MDSNTSYSASSTTDSIELIELVRLFWRKKMTLIFIGVICVAVGVVVSLLLPEKYQSEALLLPVSSAEPSNLGGLSSQLGGLASFAGIDLSSQDNNKHEVALKVLQSRKFIQDFIERHQLLIELMATKEWIAEANKLVINETMYSSEEKKWVREVAFPYEPKPSPQEAYIVFADNFNVQQDKQGGSLRISYQHASPFIAKQWIDWLIDDLNQYMRERDIQQAEKSISFMQQQIENTQNVDLRVVFFEIVEQQTRILMLANSRADYVYEVIDPAQVAEKRYTPNRILIVLLSGFIGAFIGIIYLVILIFWQRLRR